MGNKVSLGREKGVKEEGSAKGGKLSEVVVEVKNTAGVVLETFPHFSAGVRVQSVLNYIGSTYRGRLETASGEYLLDPNTKLHAGFYVFRISLSHELEVAALQATRQAELSRSEYFSLKAEKLQETVTRRTENKQERLEVIRIANTAIETSQPKQSSRSVTLADVEQKRAPMIMGIDEQLLNAAPEGHEEILDRHSTERVSAESSIHTLSTEGMDSKDSDDSDEEESTDVGRKH